MLTLEQCQKLKGWGLPQTILYGEHYYPYESEVAVVWVSRTVNADYPSTLKCPDLEQLLEFANRKISDKLKLSPYSHFLSLSCPMTGEGWEAYYTTTTGIGATDPNPKQAIYNLLEQIIEPNNKVDDSGATEDPLANTVKLSELDVTDEKENDD